MKLWLLVLTVAVCFGCKSAHVQKPDRTVPVPVVRDAAGQTFEQGRCAAMGLRIGMTTADVRSALGEPDEKSVSAARETWVYEWNQTPRKSLQIVFETGTPSLSEFGTGVGFHMRVTSWAWIGL